jgi:hypothetical protein
MITGSSGRPLLISRIARLLLHSVERAGVQKPNAVTAVWRHAPDTEADIAASMLEMARSIGSDGRCGAEEMSPFCLEAMYRSGIFYARRFRNTRDQIDLEALEAIKRGLRVINDRWKASGTQLVTTWLPQQLSGLLTAGAYIEMLEARNLSGIL